MHKYQKSERILPCKLTKADLEKLVLLIQQDFTDMYRTDDFEISTRFEGHFIRENDLETFLSYTQLPTVLNSLEISRIGWADGQIIQSLTLDLSQYDIRLSVNGNSEVWVNGKYNQVKEFLKRNKVTWVTVFHSYLMHVLFGAGIALVGFGGLVFLLEYLNLNVELWKKLSVTFVFFLVIMGVYKLSYWYMNGIISYTRIILDPQKNTNSKVFLRYLWLTIVNVGILVGILSGIVTVLDYLKV